MAATVRWNRLRGGRRGTRRPHRSLGSEFVAPRRPWPAGSRTSKPWLRRRIQVLSPIGADPTTSAFWLRRVAGRTGCGACGPGRRPAGPPAGAGGPLVAAGAADAEKGWPPVFRARSAPDGSPGPPGGWLPAGVIDGGPGGPAVAPCGDAADEDSGTGPARALPEAVSVPGRAIPTGACTSTSASQPESRHSTVRVPIPVATAAARSHAGPSPCTATWAAASAARSAAASARWRASTADPRCRPKTSAATSTATAPAAQTVARPASSSGAGLMGSPPRVRRRRSPGRRSVAAGATGALPRRRPRRCRRRG